MQESLTLDQFAAIIAGRKVIGDPRVKTQHLLGGGSWNSPGDGTAQVWWQLRVAHQRCEAEDMAVVINKGHGHGANQHTYKRLMAFERLLVLMLRMAGSKATCGVRFTAQREHELSIRSPSQYPFREIGRQAMVWIIFTFKVSISHDI